MMSATPEPESMEQTQLPAPPQPPLPLSDPAFNAPPIVHGIDPDDTTSPTESSHITHSSQQDTRPYFPRDGITNVFADFSAKFSRVVRASTSEVARVVESAASPLNGNNTTTNKTDVDNSAPRSVPTTTASQTMIPTDPQIQPTIFPSILLFGDSITQYSSRLCKPDGPGWAALLREAYGVSVDIYQRGFSGYNTKLASRIFPKIATGVPKVSVVVIFFGANDATKSGSLQHVPLAEYKHNLGAMVKYVQEKMAGNPIPVLITPPPLSEKRLETDNERNMETTAIYAEACVEVARRLNCAVVDLHTAITQRAEPNDAHLDDFLTDGLHLSTEGNRIVYDLLAEILLECAPQVAPNLVERPFPLYEEIDPENMDECLGPAILE